MVPSRTRISAALALVRPWRGAEESGQGQEVNWEKFSSHSDAGADNLEEVHPIAFPQLLQRYLVVILLG